MSHAERCPVCFGSGKYNPSPQIIGTAPNEDRTCHACMGKGYVVINDMNDAGFFPQLFKFVLTDPAHDTTAADTSGVWRA